MVKRKRKNKVSKQLTQENIELNNSSRKLFRRIRDGVEDGESGASMLRRFRASGLHIGNSEFYKTVRLAKSYRIAGTTVKNARLDTIVPDNKIPLVPAHIVMRGNYQYVVKLTASNKSDLDAEGNVKTAYLTVRSAQALSRRQINTITASMVEAGNTQGKEKYEFTGDNFRISIEESYRRV